MRRGLGVLKGLKEQTQTYRKTIFYMLFEVNYYIRGATCDSAWNPRLPLMLAWRHYDTIPLESLEEESLALAQTS